MKDVLVYNRHAHRVVMAARLRVAAGRGLTRKGGTLQSLPQARRDGCWDVYAPKWEG